MQTREAYTRVSEPVNARNISLSPSKRLCYCLLNLQAAGHEVWRQAPIALLDQNHRFIEEVIPSQMFEGAVRTDGFEGKMIEWIQFLRQSSGVTKQWRNS